MKIVAQKIFVVNASRTNFVFVKIFTDDGIEGVGEATLEWKTKTSSPRWKISSGC